MVRTIRWMHKNFPTRFLISELLARHHRYVGSGVILIKHKSSFVDQSWALLGDWHHQTFQLLTVLAKIKSSSSQRIISNRFRTKLTTKLSWLTILTWNRLCRLTVLRPQPFSLDVALSDPLFITIHRFDGLILLRPKSASQLKIRSLGLFLVNSSVTRVFCVSNIFQNCA